MNKIKAFTLSEVLITLIIIGIVASVTVPVLNSNVQRKVKEERVSNIRQKFSKGTDAMFSTVGMNGYSSTMDFVQEFAKHFKIAKICDNAHIADCWPTKTVTTVGGEEGEKVFQWEISKTKTPRDLKMPYGYNLDWDDTVGIVTADGTSMILTYNKKCGKSYNDGLIWSGDNSSSNTCVAAVFDWNGSKKPNTFGLYAKNSDIYSINAGGLGQVCAIEANGKCFTPAQKSVSITSYDEAYRKSLGIKVKSYYSTDYWGGAAEMCGGAENLPQMSDLDAIVEQMYISDSVGNKRLNKDLALSIGVPDIKVENVANGTSSFAFWSTEYNMTYALHVRFYPTGKGTGYYDRYGGRDNSDPLTLCLGG